MVEAGSLLYLLVAFIGYAIGRIGHIYGGQIKSPPSLALWFGFSGPRFNFLSEFLGISRLGVWHWPFHQRF